MIIPPDNLITIKNKKMKTNLIRTVIFMIAGLCLFSNGSGQESGLVNVRRALQTITVGGAEADIPGYTSEAVQIALDATAARGGGTVRLNPGTYLINGPVRLYSNITLTGSGENTVLKKCDGFETGFIIDADWGMLKATVKDASGFRTGMGIQLYDDKNKNGWNVTTAVITDIEDNVIYFDRSTVHDYLSSLNGTVTNSFPVIEAIGVENVTIKDLVVEGNKNSNAYINGCRAGGVYIHRSRDCLVENARVSNFNGDSFSWQVTENITFRGCEASNGEGLGFHPGTGSDRSIIEDCSSHHNRGDGIFLCWRVQNSIFRNNIVYANGDNGFSIGHKDTDNLFENNHVYENSNHGVFFRNENEQNSGHRNLFVNNIIENNGTARESAGFYIGGVTKDITIKNNVIRSTGNGNQSTAILIGKKSSNIIYEGNKISGSKEVAYEK